MSISGSRILQTSLKAAAHALLASLLFLTACSLDIPDRTPTGSDTSGPDHDPSDRDTGWPDPGGGGSPGQDVTPDPTRDAATQDSVIPGLYDLHLELLEPSCGSCHIDLTPAAGGLDLTLDADLRARLLSPSSQLSSMPLVTPRDLAESYLWHKIEGTHHEVGGSGQQMPSDDTPLTHQQIHQIERWIEAGAPLVEVN